MHTEEAAKTNIMASATRSGPSIQSEMEARAITVLWMHSIEADSALLDVTPDSTLVITELALRDGNWRDLAERVRCTGKLIRTALVRPARTHKLWWDALGCGVEDMLPAPLSVPCIYEYLKK